MGLRVNTNVASVNAQRNLVNTTDRLQRSLERLSSGLRITRASDDAAGLAISEGFRAEIRSFVQAQRNANDAISLLQIAEGALNESSSILIRLRELAIQSSNGTLGSSERTTLNNEFTALRDELSRIANVTEFNGTAVLNSASVTVTFQVGINNTSNDRITVTGVNATATGLSIQTQGITTSAAANAAISAISTAIDSLASLRAQFGTAQNRLESTIRSIAVSIENTSIARPGER